MDCCMQLHQWEQALQLAQQCNFTEAEDLLQQYAQHLLEKKKYLEAVELYRKVSTCVYSGAITQGTVVPGCQAGLARLANATGSPAPSGCESSSAMRALGQADAASYSRCCPPNLSLLAQLLSREGLR